MTLRWSEPRHDALRAAAENRLTFQSGAAKSKGSFWVQLPGMPEDEKTTNPRLFACVTALIAHGYLRHASPGIPRRSGMVAITGPGRDALAHFDEIIARRNATA